MSTETKKTTRDDVMALIKRAEQEKARTKYISQSTLRRISSAGFESGMDHAEYLKLTAHLYK